MHHEILPLMFMIHYEICYNCLPNDKGGLGHTLQGVIRFKGPLSGLTLQGPLSVQH